jgi:hypothetical protein
VALALTPRQPLAQTTRPEGLPLEALLPSPGTPSLDQGRLVISQGGKPVRVEDFTFKQAGHVLLVQASSSVSAAGRDDREVDKSATVVMGAEDFAIETYRSAWVVGPDTLWRGFELPPGDTLCTIWRESSVGGVGDHIAVPPGRIYVLDPPLFTTFTVIARSLQGKVCDQRPIQVLVLGVRDSLVAGTVNEIGTETIRWGGRPVVARKLVIADAQTDFVAWVAPDGRLLRLEQPTAGIRVDREAPPVKRRAPRPR